MYHNTSQHLPHFMHGFAILWLNQQSHGGLVADSLDVATHLIFPYPPGYILSTPRDTAAYKRFTSLVSWTDRVLSIDWIKDRIDLRSLLPEESYMIHLPGHSEGPHHASGTTCASTLAKASASAPTRPVHATRGPIGAGMEAFPIKVEDEEDDEPIFISSPPRDETNVAPSGNRPTSPRSCVGLSS